MSTDYLITCFTCEETGPIFASASISYGYKVWDLADVKLWLGHRENVGKHEGHDIRIVSENIDLPWERK